MCDERRCEGWRESGRASTKHDSDSGDEPRPFLSSPRPFLTPLAWAPAFFDFGLGRGQPGERPPHRFAFLGRSSPLASDGPRVLRVRYRFSTTAHPHLDLLSDGRGLLLRVNAEYVLHGVHDVSVGVGESCCWRGGSCS